MENMRRYSLSHGYDDDVDGDDDDDAWEGDVDG